MAHPCLSLDPLAEHVHQAGANQEDGEHLDEVGQGGGVLEWVGGVGVEEPATVGAQHLDGFLSRHRPLGDRLLCALQRVSHGVGAQVMRRTLPDQEESIEEADGQQNVDDAAHQVDPERADALAASPREATYQGYRPDDAGRRGEEVVDGQTRHLGQVAHGGLAAVVLPVGVGSEAGGGIPGQERGHIREVLGVEEAAMPLLGPLDAGTGAGGRRC